VSAANANDFVHIPYRNLIARLGIQLQRFRNI